MPPTYVFWQENVRDGSTDWQSGQELTLQYEATCDTATVDAGDVIAALAVTLGVGKGSPHPTYAYALCTTVRAVVVEANPFRWIVTATFQEPKPQPGDAVNPSGGQPSPENREPWLVFSFRREDVFRGRDAGVLNPRNFVNTAGDLFDNPPPIPLGVGQLTITKYFTSISYVALSAYQNACNDDDFFDFPPHSLCVMGINATPHSERGWTGYKVVFNLEHRKKTPEQGLIQPANFTGGGVGNPFTAALADLPAGAASVTGGYHPIPVLDVGWLYRGATEKLPYDEPDGSGVPKPVPGFLDGTSGQKGATPFYLGFDMHPRISFDVMGPP